MRASSSVTVSSESRTPAVQSADLRAHFHSKACCRLPILTSNIPGSTTRLLSAPMKDKSSEVSSKELCGSRQAGATPSRIA